MTARAGAPVPADPRPRWLQQAVDRLHAEFDPGTRVAGITVSTITADNEFLIYSIYANGGEILRQVVTHPKETFAGVAELVADAVINVTPPTHNDDGAVA